MNQLHIHNDYIKLIDSLCQIPDRQESYDLYVKLLSFASEIEYSRFNYRINQYRTLSTIIKNNYKSLKEFSTFADLEQYIYQHECELKLINGHIHSYKALKGEYGQILKDTLIKCLKDHFPNLTGSNRDKLVSLVWSHEPEASNNSQYTLYSVFNTLTKMYENPEIMDFHGFDIEKCKSYSEFANQISTFLNDGKKSMELYKMIKPELKKLAKENPAQWSRCVKGMSKKLSFYEQLIDQSHRYTSVESFFIDAKKLETAMRRDEIVKLIQKSGARQIEYYNNYEIVALVDSWKQVNLIGLTNWCLTNSISDWNSYVKPNHKFVIVWNFDKDNEMDVYGIVVNDKMDIVNCQNKNNNRCTYRNSAELKKALLESSHKYSHSQFNDYQKDIEMLKKMSNVLNPNTIDKKEVVIYDPEKNIFTKTFMM